MTAAAVGLIGHDHILLCDNRIRELILRLDDRSVGQLDRAVGVNDASLGDLDIFLALIRLRRVDGTGDCCLITLHLNAAVRLLRAVQCAAVAGRHDDIVLVVGRGELTVRAGQLNGAVGVLLRPLGIEFKRCCGEVRAGVVLLLVRSHPVEEGVAVPLEGVGDDGAFLALDGLDMHDAVGAVVDVVGHDDNYRTGLGIAVIILGFFLAVLVHLDLAAIGLRDRVGTVRVQRTAVGQEDGLPLAVRLGDGDGAVVGNGDDTGSRFTGDAGTRAGHIGGLVVRVAVLAGNGDGRAVLLVPLGIPGLRYTLLCGDGVSGSLEGAGAVAVCLSVPAAKGPAGHDEGVGRAQRHREFRGVIGTHGVLDLVRVCGAIVGQIGDRGGMGVDRLAPLGIEGHISGGAGNFRILTKIRSAHAVFRRAPAGKELTSVGEGVEDGADGLIVSIDVDLIVTHAAVGLVDHSAVAGRHCAGQLIVGLDRAAAGAVRFGGQNDAAVGLDDRAAGDLDLFLTLIRVCRVNGTGHSARAVLRDLDAAVRLRAGDRSAGSGLDDHIVRVIRRGDFVIPTGQDDGAVRAAVVDHQCAFVRGRGDGDRIAVDILCSAIVQLIGFCQITVKGRNINAVFLILADLDGLFLCQRIAVVQILHGQVILILRCGGLRIVICDFLISVPTGELDASVEAGGQRCCRAVAHADDTHQRVARLVGRGQGQTVGRRSAVAVRFIHLTGVVKHGCPAVCYSIDRNRNEVRLIVEGLFRWLVGFHRQEMGAILTGAQLVLAVQNVCRRGDGHLFAGHRIKGILIERHARLVSGAGAVLDDNGAGGLGNIHKVDLQVPGLVRHLIVLAVVIPQRPAAKALRHGLVGLAHAGLFRGDRTQIGDGVGANRAVLDCVVQSLVRFVQFGLVHCNKVHIAGLLGVADGVGCLHRKCGTISITSGAIWFERICGHVVRYKVIAKRR